MIRSRFDVYITDIKAERIYGVICWQYNPKISVVRYAFKSNWRSNIIIINTCNSYFCKFDIRVSATLPISKRRKAISPKIPDSRETPVNPCRHTAVPKTTQEPRENRSDKIRDKIRSGKA